MFHCLPSSDWADGNWAEVAVQLGKMVEHPNQSQPNPGLRADESPCTIVSSLQVSHPLYQVSDGRRACQSEGPLPQAPARHVHRGGQREPERPPGLPHDEQRLRESHPPSLEVQFFLLCAAQMNEILVSLI